MYHVFKIFQTGNRTHWHFQCWSHCLPSEGAGSRQQNCVQRLARWPHCPLSMSQPQSFQPWLLPDSLLRTLVGMHSSHARHPDTAVSAVSRPLWDPHMVAWGRELPSHAPTPMLGVPGQPIMPSGTQPGSEDPGRRPVTGALGLILGSAFQDWRGRVGVQCPPGRALPYVVFLDK